MLADSDCLVAADVVAEIETREPYSPDAGLRLVALCSAVVEDVDGRVENATELRVHRWGERSDHDCCCISVRVLMNRWLVRLQGHHLHPGQPCTAVRGLECLQ